MGTSEEPDNFYRLNPFLRKLRDELQELDRNKQLAFAAYCSERLYPFYEALAGVLAAEDGGGLRSSLDRIWKHIEGDTLSAGEIETLLEKVGQIDLGEEGCCAEWDGGVDAAGATWLTQGTEKRLWTS